jgi:hypothetical protein
MRYLPGKKGLGRKAGEYTRAYVSLRGCVTAGILRASMRGCWNHVNMINCLYLILKNQ